MLRRIPDKNTVSLFEKADLFIEEAMIRRQPRKENQCLIGLRFLFIRPVMDFAAGRLKQFFFH